MSGQTNPVDVAAHCWSCHCLLLSQHPLGGRYLSSSPRVNFTSSPQGPCKGLECCLDYVVRVAASQLPDVECHAAGVHH